jgi:hypothetical protein
MSGVVYASGRMSKKMTHVSFKRVSSEKMLTQGVRKKVALLPERTRGAERRLSLPTSLRLCQALQTQSSVRQKPLQEGADIRACTLTY